jgi:PAS domain S-box-containing protein
MAMALIPDMDYLGFAALFNVQQNATLLIDENDKIILATAAAQSLLGYENAGLDGLPIQTIIPDLDIKQLRQHHIANSADTQQHLITNNNHLTALTQDGKKLCVTANITSLSTHNKLLVITIFYDRRKRAEDSLQKSEERLKLAKRAAGLGLYDRDLRDNSLYWDERSRELLGFSADEEISYEKFEACVHPDDLEHRREVLAQALNPDGSGEYQTEFRIFRKNDGSERWISSAGLISFEDGQPVRLLGLMRDITDLKDKENQSHWRRHETESLLKQQIAMHTASAIAHEINQPLAAISAYSEVALHSLKNRNINSDSLYRALEGCVTQAQRAGDTLHELMNFLNQRDLAVEAADINQLINASIEIAKKDGYNGFKPLLLLEKKLPPVLCNPLQVQKVILNLLRNAIDAVQAANLSATDITIKVQKDEINNMALITVQDSGPGFAKEASANIFKPFFTSKQKGIGMGLVISRSLIEANGGKLWHEPNADSGAIIHFTLPFAT